MHTIFFGLKRAHHGALRITRYPLAAFGITPARYDLLYAVKRRRKGILQKLLPQILGVCRATVSRMLVSLEKLGYITRTLSTRDRRKKIVKLTWEGKKRIAAAHKACVKTGWAQLAFDSAMSAAGLANPCDAASAMEAETSLDARLHAIRRAFGDFAVLDYSRELEDTLFTHEQAMFDVIAEREKREGIGEPPAGACPWDLAQFE